MSIQFGKFEEHTSLKEEHEKGRFPIVNSWLWWRSPVVRPYCKWYQGEVVRIDPTLEDKFKYAPLYILGTKTRAGYTTVAGDALPVGNYLYIIERDTDGEPVVILSRVFDDSLEIGTRHSILPPGLQTQVLSAGELKRGATVYFNFKSYTFGDSLIEKAGEKRLADETKRVLLEYFPGASYDKYFRPRFTKEERAEAERIYQAACRYIQKFETFEACQASLQTLSRGSDACQSPIDPEFVAELSSYYVVADRLNRAGDGSPSYLALWSIMRAGRAALFELIGTPGKFQEKYPGADIGILEDLTRGARFLRGGTGKKRERA